MTTYDTSHAGASYASKSVNDEFSLSWSSVKSGQSAPSWSDSSGSVLGPQSRYSSGLAGGWYMVARQSSWYQLVMLKLSLTAQRICRAGRASVVA